MVFWSHIWKGGTQIFNCTFCEYKANTKIKLKRHIEVHRTQDTSKDENGDIKPELKNQKFVCPISSCTFNLRKNNPTILKLHIEEKHQNTPGKDNLKFLVL